MAVATLSESRAYAETPEHVFDVLMAVPLEQVFTHRRGPISPIRAVRDAPPTWDAVGQTRTILLSDGNRMREALTSVDRPRSFGYEITPIRGSLVLVTSRVEGSWRVDPEVVDAEPGCRVTWTWQVHHRQPFGRIGVPLLARFWNGYAAEALEELERHLATA